MGNTFTTFTKRLVGVYYTQLINFGKLTIPFLLSTVLGTIFYLLNQLRIVDIKTPLLLKNFPI